MKPQYVIVRSNSYLNVWVYGPYRSERVARREAKKMEETRLSEHYLVTPLESLDVLKEIAA